MSRPWQAFTAFIHLSDTYNHGDGAGDDAEDDDDDDDANDYDDHLVWLLW